MRIVVKPQTDITDKLASNKTYLELLDIATNKAKDNIKDSIYREPYDNPDEKRSRVEDQLALSYFNKCGYCERLCKADIEHYRPKKKVNDDTVHDGYYWLCYEWTNLLPACVKCNRDGGKHSKFPIIGTRVYDPSFLPDTNLNLSESKAQNNPLVAEIPFLLHPEVDNPETYFGFENDINGEGIRLVGIDAEDRGAQTIEICSLNRLELRLERVENVINQFKQAIESSFVMWSNGTFTDDQFENQVLFQLNQLFQVSNNDQSTHTLLRKYIVKSSENFEDIALPFLTSSIRTVVLEAFKTI